MPTPTYTPLANITLGSSASSVTFSNIPNTYRDLICVANFIGNNSNASLAISFNGVTTNQSGVRMYGTGSSYASDGYTALDGAVGTTRGDAVVQIFDYAVTDKHKTILYRNGQADRIVIAGAGRWAQTTAITSFALTTNASFNSGSTFALFGVIA